MNLKIGKWEIIFSKDEPDIVILKDCFGEEFEVDLTHLDKILDSITTLKKR